MERRKRLRPTTGPRYRSSEDGRGEMRVHDIWPDPIDNFVQFTCGTQVLEGVHAAWELHRVHLHAVVGQSRRARAPQFFVRTSEMNLCAVCSQREAELAQKAAIADKFWDYEEEAHLLGSGGRSMVAGCFRNDARAKTMGVERISRLPHALEGEVLEDASISRRSVAGARGPVAELGKRTSD